MAEAIAGGVVRRIYGNLARLLSGKAAAGIVSLAYMVIAARALGPTDYGVLVLVHGFAMTVGGIVEFPGWHAVVRYGAQARARGDAPAIARLLRFVGGVEMAGGIAAVVTAAVLAPILGPGLGWSATALAFALPYSLAVLASVRSTAAGYLQLMGRFDLLGIHNVVAPLVRLVGALAAWAAGFGLFAFLVAWLVAALAEWAAMWLMAIMVARRELGGAPFHASVRDIRREHPGIWRFMLIANADVTFGELAGRIAPLIVGWVLGAEAVGLFAIAQRATTIIAQPAVILGQAAFAELARLAATADHGPRLRRAVLHCIAIAAISALPVIALLAFFARDVAVLIGGQAYAGAAGILIWLTCARAIMLAGPPASAALIAVGRPALSVTANMVASFGLLPLLPLLLMRHGLDGAGWQAVAQAALTSAMLLCFVLRETRSAPARAAVGVA